MARKRQCVADHPEFALNPRSLPSNVATLMQRALPCFGIERTFPIGRSSDPNRMIARIGDQISAAPPEVMR